MVVLPDIIDRLPKQLVRRGSFGFQHRYGGVAALYDASKSQQDLCQIDIARFSVENAFLFSLVPNPAPLEPV